MPITDCCMPCIVEHCSGKAVLLSYGAQTKMHVGLYQARCLLYQRLYKCLTSSICSQSHVAGQQLRVQRLCQQLWMEICQIKTGLCNLEPRGYFATWHHLPAVHIQRQAVRLSCHVGVVRIVLGNCVVYSALTYRHLTFYTFMCLSFPCISHLS